MSTNSNPWLKTIAEQEGTISLLERKLAVAQHTNLEFTALSVAQHAHLQTLQTVCCSALELEQPKELFLEAIRAIVTQLHWSSAMVIQLVGDDITVLAAYQSTEGQLQHIRRFGAKTPALVSAALASREISTFKNQDTEALALRVLFSTDNVIAVPILAHGLQYGYLVACSHGVEQRNSPTELQFLANLATVLASAVWRINRIT